MATASGGRALVWLVMLGEVVIGDCGTVGGLDDAGAIEVGYGLAAEHRGRSYGNELVAALSGWLLSQPEVEQVVGERSSPTTLLRAARWRTQASCSSARSAA